MVTAVGRLMYLKALFMSFIYTTTPITRQGAQVIILPQVEPILHQYVVKTIIYQSRQVTTISITMVDQREMHHAIIVEWMQGSVKASVVLGLMRLTAGYEQIENVRVVPGMTQVSALHRSAQEVVVLANQVVNVLAPLGTSVPLQQMFVRHAIQAEAVVHRLTIIHSQGALVEVALIMILRLM